MALDAPTDATPARQEASISDAITGNQQAMSDGARQNFSTQAIGLFESENKGPETNLISGQQVSEADGVVPPDVAPDGLGVKGVFRTGHDRAESNPQGVPDAEVEPNGSGLLFRGTASVAAAIADVNRGPSAANRQLTDDRFDIMVDGHGRNEAVNQVPNPHESPEEENARRAARGVAA